MAVEDKVLASLLPLSHNLTEGYLVHIPFPTGGKIYEAVRNLLSNPLTHYSKCTGISLLLIFVALDSLLR